MKLQIVGSSFKLEQNVTIKGITIPKGFITDFASIPQWALSFTGRPTKKEFQRASLLHDYILVENLMNNKEASKVFYELLLEDKTYKPKAYIMYLAVRYFRKWH